MKSPSHPRGQCALRFPRSSLLLFPLITTLPAVEPPARMSSTMTGVYVGTSYPVTDAFQRFKDHEGWLGRPVDSILVYSITNSWKQW